MNAPHSIWIAVDASGLRAITGATSQEEADAAVASLDASYPEDAPHRVLRYELVFRYETQAGAST